MEPVNPNKQLQAALGRIVSGMFVITARREPGETGMLASWVQQCSFQPPQLSVAIQRGREIADLLGTNSAFTLNILEESQTDMIVHFGRGFELPEPAFQNLEIERAESGGPVLQEALAYLRHSISGLGGRWMNDGAVGERGRSPTAPDPAGGITEPRTPPRRSA